MADQDEQTAPQDVSEETTSEGQTQQSMIEDMLSSYQTDQPSEPEDEATAQTEPEERAVADEADTQDEASGGDGESGQPEEAVEVDPSEPEVEVEKGQTEQQVDPEVQRLREQNQELQDRLERLERQQQADELEAPVQGNEDEAQDAESETETGSEVEPHQFMTDEEAQQLFGVEGAGTVNEMLNRVYNRAREDTIREIPELVEKTQERQQTMQNAVQSFYEDNPELKKYKDYVSHKANEVQAENPDMDIENLMEETAKRAKEGLQLHEKAKETEKERREKEEATNNDPAFAPKARGERGGSGPDNRSGQQKQIDELISS